MGTLSLALLGRFQAVLDGEVLAGFRTNKVQALLIYLAVERANPHRRESLMTLLWPGMPERSARHNLRQVLYHLRREIPDLSPKDSSGQTTAVPLILANRQTIQLNPLADVCIDTAQFEAHSRQAQTHDHLDLLTCRACHQELETAVALYRGDFLADFYLDDSNEFEEWAETSRQTYRRKALDALETLTTVNTRQKAFTEARAFAEQQLEIDELRESGYRQLMEIMALSGQREEALALYETCRRRLAEELGMAPTTQTTALYERIQAGDLRFDVPQVQGVRGYDLKEEIGEGAFGTIHRAIQPGIGREVAVKVIRRRYANDPEFIRRFEAEAQTIARLEHPYIVPLYDYWRDPEGAYLVMRLLRGGNLLASLEGGPWGVEPTLKMLDQIASALAAAHRQGIVHRDIKPANVLFDEAGNAYLSDFGIAKNLTGDMRLTAVGAIMGTPDYISPEQLLNDPVSPQSDLYSLGAVLYETLTGEKPFPDASLAMIIQKQLNEPIPPVSASRSDLPRQIDAVIQRATAKRPRDRYPDVLAMAEAFRQATRENGVHVAGVTPVLSEVGVAVPAAVDIINPYKGLRAFQEADAADFYGRETLVEQLVARLAESRFLAVVGPSGSGKSSAVKAGLIPALREGAVPGSEKWFVAEMVPGSYPMEELELALLPIAVDPPPSLLEPLQKDKRGLLRTVRRILPDEDGAQLLLVVDQFEELFTLVEDEARRVHFLDSLLAALAAPRTPLRVVVTLRADFYDRPLQYQPVGELFKQHTEVVLPLTQDELTWAIQEPARRVGVGIEEGVVAAMTTDVVDQPGALPLLQYALTELFEERQDHTMSLASYRAIGGVPGALAQRAEELYANLDSTEQERVRQLFLRLVTLGEGVEDTRRRVRLSELEALSVNGKQLSVNGDRLSENEFPITDSRLPLTKFGEHRILTFDRDPNTREPTVEVAHEALLREWPRLRRWLDQSRDDIRIQRRLAAAAAEWEQSSRDEGFLLRGSRLDLFSGWTAVSDLALTHVEKTFLDTCLTAQQERRTAETARQQRELETIRQLAETEKVRADEQTRSANQLRRRAVYLSGALLIAAVLAVAALLFGRQATKNERLATSRELAAAALNNLDVDPERSVLLALQALSEAYTIEAENALHESIPELHLLHTLTGHTEMVESVAVSPDRTRLASASDDGIVKVWDVTTGQELLSFSTYHTGISIFGLAFSPDGARMATASDDQTAKVWDTTTGEQLLVINHGAPLSAVAFSPDGKRLATAGADATARVWDSASGQQLLVLTGHAEAIRAGSIHPGGVIGVIFAPNGKRLVTAGADGTARLWDAENGQALSVISGHTNEIYIALSPDGQRLLTGGYDGFVKLWDISSGAETNEPLVIINHEQSARAAAFSPDGTRVAAASQDGAARVWDAASGRRLLTLVGHAGVVDDLTFTPDGTRLVTVGEDKTVKVWDLAPGRELLTLVGAGSPAYSPDGKRLATAQSDGTVAVRDSTTGQELLILAGHPEFGTFHIAFSPDGKHLATASWDRTAKLWDASTGSELFTLSGHTDYIFNVSFNQDGTCLVTSSADGTAKVWNTRTGQELFTLLGHSRWVQGAAYSPDGMRIATSSDDGTARIWDAVTGQELETLNAGVSLSSIAFSPDGKLLAAGRSDGKVMVWDISGAESRVITTLSGHSAFIGRITFSPDGARLATSSFDGTAKLWDLKTGQEWLTLSAEDPLDTAIFSPDGTRLATGAFGGGQVRVYVLELEDLVELAQSRITRSLTDEECQRFLHVAVCPERP